MSAWIQCAVIPKNAAFIGSTDQRSMVVEIRPLDGDCFKFEKSERRQCGTNVSKGVTTTITTNLNFHLQLLDKVDEFIVNVYADVVGGWYVGFGSVWPHCYQTVSKCCVISNHE